MNTILLDAVRCYVCQLPTGDPISCTQGGHVLCAQCAGHVRDGGTCGVCRAPRFTRCPLVHRLVANCGELLDVACENEECGQCMPLAKYDEHRRHCPHRLVLCPLHPTACGLVEAVELRRHLARHRETLSVDAEGGRLWLVSGCRVHDHHVVLCGPAGFVVHVMSNPEHTFVNVWRVGATAASDARATVRNCDPADASNYHEVRVAPCAADDEERWNDVMPRLHASTVSFCPYRTATADGSDDANVVHAIVGSRSEAWPRRNALPLRWTEVTPAPALELLDRHSPRGSAVVLLRVDFDVC